MVLKQVQELFDGSVLFLTAVGDSRMRSAGNELVGEKGRWLAKPSSPELIIKSLKELLDNLHATKGNN